MKAKTFGNGSLRAAMAALVQAQAIFVNSQAGFVARAAETDRELAQLRRSSDERFARIEAALAEVIRVQAEHSRILAALPDLIRAKIGFKPAP